MIKNKQRESQDKAKEFNIYANKNIKLCQSCKYFSIITFLHNEEDYWHEDFGCFTLWVWDGICLKSGNDTTSKGYCKEHKKENNEDGSIGK